jgi:SAM-dependent methyltransferase
LGSGFNKLESDEVVEWINVDAFPVCKPDVLHDLNTFPYPWADESIDRIVAFHVMEHIPNWWGAFNECIRILRVGGEIEVRVPHPGSDTALAYRDHLHVINLASFDGTMSGPVSTSNAWFESQDKIPAKLVGYFLVPWKKYAWMPNWMLDWCAEHLRNFVWEQRIVFQKVGQ